MVLPDGFVIKEVYKDRAIASSDLEEYRELMTDMFCPLSCKQCRRDCMFFDEGCLRTKGDNTLELGIPKCTAFLGGQG